MTQANQEFYTALILYSIRIAQTRVDQDPELHAFNLKQWYGIDIDPDAIANELEDLAETINSEDRELLAV
jgi:hypothetical protein